MRLLYVVLDGAPDGFSDKTALSIAYKPNMDMLASRSLCGLAYILGEGVAPESDAAVMSLLGYDPEVYYTGRGPLEALGAGLEFKDGWVALRANFATIDPSTLRIVDRRVGRSLSSIEARRLGEAIDGLKLDGGRAIAKFKATIGHRGVLLISHEDYRLSGNISNTDPAYERRGRISVALESYDPYVKKAVPLDESIEAKIAAELVNEYTAKAIEILREHEVNRDRVSRGLPPANAVLLRDAGDRLPPAKPIREVYGLNFASIVEMVVERGIARALGIHDLPVDVEGRPRSEIIHQEAIMAHRALEQYDAVYVHLKGPDEPGHDGDLEGKVKAIEEIDKHFFGEVLNRIDHDDTLILVTSDHATPWFKRAHSGDPVPVMLSHGSFRHVNRKFREVDCRNGELGVIDKGYKILKITIDIMNKIDRQEI